MAVRSFRRLTLAPIRPDFSLALALATLLLLLCVASAAAAVPGEEVWLKTFAPPSGHVSGAPMLVIAPGGEIYVGGSFLPVSGKASYFVARYSSSGRRLWIRYWQANGFASAMAADPAGNIVMCGSAPGADGQADWALVKYSRAGRRLWTKTGGIAGSDPAKDVAIDGRGGIYVTRSEIRPYPVGACTTTMGFSATGRKLWTRRHFAALGSNAGSIVWSQGGLYVAAQDWLFGSPISVAVLKYNRKGEDVWVHWFMDGSLSAVIEDMSASPAGVVVTGHEENLPSDGFVVSYKHDGTSSYGGVIHMSTYTGFRDCAIDAAGECYVAGNVIIDSGGPVEFVILRYGAGGETLIYRKAGQVGSNAGAAAIALSADGRPYATGYRTTVPGGSVMWTATGPDPGSWAAQWAGELTTNEEGTDIEVRGSAVYVVGFVDDARVVVARYAR